MNSTADTIRRLGWRQNMLIDNRSQVCLLGARLVASGQVESWRPRDVDIHGVRLLATTVDWTILAWKVIREQFPEEAEKIMRYHRTYCDLSGLVTSWNDSDRRKESEVLMVAEKTDALYAELV